MHFVKSAIDFNRSIRQEFNDVSKPLESFGIDYFTYGRIYKNGKVLLLSNEDPDYKLYEYLSSKGLCFPEPFVKAHQNGKHVFVWPEGKNKAMEGQEISIWNGLNFYVDKGDFIETWCYSSSQYDGERTNFYLNNLEFLEKFLNYFKGNFYELLKKANEKSLMSFNAPLLSQERREFDWPLKLNVFHKKNRLFLKYQEIESYLTLQEFYCLINLSEGLCPQEIANIMNLSLGTVQMYFNKIKEKFSLTFLNDLRRFSLFVKKLFIF